MARIMRRCLIICAHRLLPQRRRHRLLKQCEVLRLHEM
jgi:hypothetical protein